MIIHNALQEFIDHRPTDISGRCPTTRILHNFCRNGISLTTELTSQIIQEQARESIRVARVDNTTSVPNPQAGDIRFNISTSKFQGYTGSAWVDFH